MSLTKLTPSEAKAVRCLWTHLNLYGRMPSHRELMHAMGYKSPRSASVVLEKLTRKKIIFKNSNNKIQFSEGFSSKLNDTSTVEIPLVGVTSCGGPVLAEENIEAYFKISRRFIKDGARYFLLKVQGDSMDQAGISDGDIVLVRQQNTAEKGEIVLALIDNEATIKKYVPGKDFILLKPCSSNPSHKPIILTKDFCIQGVVIKSFSDL